MKNETWLDIVTRATVHMGIELELGLLLLPAGICCAARSGADVPLFGYPNKKTLQSVRHNLAHAHPLQLIFF